MGLRLRVSDHEWAGLELNAGQRVQVRRAEHKDEPLSLAKAVKEPPFVWQVMHACAAQAG